MTLTPGQEISPVDLGDLLTAAGYTRQDPVDESGEFCVRGGVVDFYPAGARQPLRLEFIGDTIESIRSYDPSTQRSTAVLDQAAIAPLQELIASQRRGRTARIDRQPSSTTCGSDSALPCSSPSPTKSRRTARS